MQFATRKAVSPIIATLLLIAIAVAAGIIVYVFVNSISGNLTQQGGQQVADQVSMDAYSFPTGTAPVSDILVLRNIGSSSVTLSQVYFDGNLCQGSGVVCTGVAFTTTGGVVCTASPAPVTCTAGQYTQATLTISPAPSIGTSHIIRVVTSDGGTFTFSTIYGRSG